MTVSAGGPRLWAPIARLYKYVEVDQVPYELLSNRGKTFEWMGGCQFHG